MKRTISAMIGKGSVTHNSRCFTAENVDSDRTPLNIDYCNEPIKKVYHEMFDDALAKYNAKQKRRDRVISNYYEKIRTCRQEKLFHEVIFQIGNKEDMAATGDHAELARTILDEYYQGFQKRNPYLRVFSAHLHMDEATPHLHIDFVPFTTGSKRGLETRVSLKKALLHQGFEGEGRDDNELNRWIFSEKKVLAEIMQQHGIEWEQKGTHEQHLSVLDYKKQERAKEVAKLERQIEDKQMEIKELKATVGKGKEAKVSLDHIERELTASPKLQLPEPQPLMSAKSYTQKIVEPLIRRLKSLIKTVIAKSVEGWDNYYHLRRLYEQLTQENSHLKFKNAQLQETNTLLRDQNKSYRLLEKTLGKAQIKTMIERNKEIKSPKQTNAR